MHDERYLAHSSGPWKKHKYFQKIGEGANAKYRYIKDKAYEKSGMKAQQEYRDAEENAEREKRYAQWDKEWVDDIKEFKGLKPTDKVEVMKDLSGKMVDGDTLVATQQAQAKGARQTADVKKKQYYKTPIGKVSSAIEKGQAKINKLLGRG